MEMIVTALKLTQIGNSVGVILPKEVLARLKLEKAIRCSSRMRPTA
jgi:antitoxin component of MazEF toxin-antitoxin module